MTASLRGGATLNPDARLTEPEADPEIGIAFGAGAATFGMRFVTAGLASAALLLWATPLMGVEGGAGNIPPYYWALLFGVEGLIALGMPALEALTVQAIGNGGHYHRPLGPLLLTSYVSSIIVDAVVVAVAFTGDGTAAFIAGIAGSLGSSIAMAVVQNSTKEVPAPPSRDWPTIQPGFSVSF
jgi:hypothetical protein